MRTGNEFQIKGALIKKEYRKAFTREGMHCSELTSLRCFTGREIVCKIYTI